MGKRRKNPTYTELGDSKRKYDAQRAKLISTSIREVGPLQDVVHPRRKSAAKQSFKYFCEKYFPDRFYLKWSNDHLAAIEMLERCVRTGGQYAYAMPRGAGKTTLAECAALWAVLYGFRRFVVIVGATRDLAVDTMEAIKTEIEVNEQLGEDFPEVCQFVRALDGINNRANGQLFNGERTRIEWTDAQVVLPTVKGSPASGAVIRVYGITGAIRGAKHVTADGASLRPDLAIIDDPQTDESAHSPSQNEDRERVITRTVLGLAGPKKRIAAIMPCTIIAPGDMADRLTDPERHPSWNGSRAKMVISYPERMDLWDAYAEIRRAEGGIQRANEYYLAHRDEMDRGAVVSWEQRYNDDEYSAIQHAMNLRYDRGAPAFDAEFQNSPHVPAQILSAKQIVADQVSIKMSGLPRGIVPRECTRLTAMVDISSRLLWYCVCAWDERFGGSVIDYGAWPDQGRAYYTQADAKPALSDIPELAKMSEDARIYAALRLLMGEMLSRSYCHEITGDRLSIERCLIDSGDWTDTIHKFCRAHYNMVVLPSKGYGIKPDQVPMSDWPRRAGERRGRDWVMRQSTLGGYGRTVVFDTNRWKSFVAERLATPEGAMGCLWLYQSPGGHQMFADHLSSEYAIQKSGRGRTVDIWQLKVGRDDNHLLDCLVGCAVAAQMQGLVWDPQAAAAVTQPVADEQVPPHMHNESKQGQRIRLSELQRAKHAREAKA